MKKAFLLNEKEGRGLLVLADENDLAFWLGLKHIELVGEGVMTTPTNFRLTETSEDYKVYGDGSAKLRTEMSTEERFGDIARELRRRKRNLIRLNRRMGGWSR